MIILYRLFGKNLSILLAFLLDAKSTKINIYKIATLKRDQTISHHFFFTIVGKTRSIFNSFPENLATFPTFFPILFIRHAILRRRIYLGFVVASGDGRPESSLHGQVSSRRQGRSRKKLVGPRFIISCCAKGREEFLGENRNRTTRLRALPYSSLRIYNKGWLGIMIHPVL